MTKEGIIQKVFKKALKKALLRLDIETTDYRDTIYLNLIDDIQKELIAEIKKYAHWMYPEFSNGKHDIISLTAHELIGDLSKEQGDIE